MEAIDCDQARAQTETRAELRNYDEPSCADTSISTSSSNPEEHVSINQLNNKALEVNSADDIRQAIKAMLSRKTLQIPNDGTDPVSLTIATIPNEVHVSITEERKPESRDQLPIQNTRKRPGRSLRAGPSKRLKRFDVEDFYIGKLSNVVNFSRRRKRRSN